MAMIKINLAPEEEIENNLWWLPDVVGFTSILLISIFLLEYHFDTIRTEINRIEQKTAEIRKKSISLSKELKAYETAEKRLSQLELMYQSIARITDSKISRYLPIILVEHLQNLKPEGVWFDHLKFGDDLGIVDELEPPPTPPPAEGQRHREPPPPPAPRPEVSESFANNTLELTGGALNNIILAEFMTQIKATASNERDSRDLRTQVYFEGLQLSQSLADVLKSNEAKTDQIRNEMPIVTWRMTLDFRDVDQNSQSTVDVASLLRHAKFSKKVVQ